MSRSAWIVAAGLLTVAATVTSWADASADEPAAKPTQVTLEIRMNNGPYEDSAYSFRQATSDLAVHKNYVDLLLNKCGSLHVNMYNGEKNRICDLGAIKLEAVPKTPPADAKWADEWINPVVGDVYLEEIADKAQKMTVAFRVDEVTPDKVTLTWVEVVPMEGPARNPGQGAAGTKGQCGGKHKA